MMLTEWGDFLAVIMIAGLLLIKLFKSMADTVIDRARLGRVFALSGRGFSKSTLDCLLKANWLGRVVPLEGGDRISGDVNTMMMLDDRHTNQEL
jgi:hypothetical protein